MPQAALVGLVKFGVGIGLSKAVATAVGSFIIKTLVWSAVSVGAQKLFGPKQRGANQERQASVARLSIGETPAEAIYGEAVVGGSLGDAFNYGGEYGTDWEVLCIVLCDHEVEELVGYYVDDTYRTFSSNGAQSGYNGALVIHFVNASRTAPPSAFSAGYAGRWTSDDVLAGRTRVWVAYKADEEVWTAGRPSFRWRVKGRKCIDPRNPGAGRVWTDNAAVCRYDWVRGVYAEDRDDEPEQRLVGRGLSEEEALADLVIVGANTCDEMVALDGGGEEKRYRVNGVIRADDAFERVEEMFAAAMAGTIIQREGGVLVEPGAAKSPVFHITEADLVSPEAVEFSDFLPETERINTVLPRYVSPAQGWKDHAAPVRRDIADIEEDGEPLEMPLSLSLVTSETQAGRCGEITRRLARLERRATLTLGPRFAWIEDGDWGTFTSERHTGGEPMMVRVEAYSLDEGWRNTLALREISAEAYGGVTEIEDGADTDTPQTPPPTARPPRITSRTVNYPLTSDVSSITIAAHDVTLDAYPWSLSLPADSVTGLDDDTIYVVFWRLSAGAYEAHPSPATTQQTTAGMVLVGVQRTALSGGGYTPPPTPPGGFEGGAGQQIP